MDNQPFYAGGLRFSCMRCSACCRNESGFVFLSEKDVSMLVSRLQIGYNEFMGRYCRWVEIDDYERLSLKEKSNFDCIFWDQRCSVYQDRPLQCRIFPFWQSIVSSSAAWAAAACSCPGINKGLMHKKNEIEGCLAKRINERLIARKRTGGNF